MYGPRGLSSFCLIPRRDAAVGFSRALARKLALNSLASWSKEWIDEDGNRLYHSRAIPRKIVGKARHIMASDMPYKTIYALNAMICSIGLEPPSYASSIGSQKCSGMGLSWISGIKGELLGGTQLCPQGVDEVRRESVGVGHATDRGARYGCRLPHHVFWGSVVKFQLGPRGFLGRLHCQRLTLWRWYHPRRGWGNRPRLRAWRLSKLWNVRDDRLKHPCYGLDLVGGCRIYDAVVIKDALPRTVDEVLAKKRPEPRGEPPGQAPLMVKSALSNGSPSDALSSIRLVLLSKKSGKSSVLFVASPKTFPRGGFYTCLSTAGHTFIINVCNVLC
ncbi:hypothetical protein BHM03_00041966 [Ensete ventricosum]|uniref:Uncharacterized protein n=1 Tax=Ensete ventricosum TaxID=4639 RepID=A0A445MKD7_ENSVE|nr:hypothetical protein BHM03_00041966 [Ensete ventricosum]